MNFLRKALILSITVFFFAGVAIPSLEAGEAAAEADEEDAPQFTIEMLDQMPVLPASLGTLPTIKAPADNPQTPEKAELGKMLYFDTRLSRDYSISCATCHNPRKGYSDGLSRTVGFGRAELGRHSPTIINSAYNHTQFWDGRAATLEEQAKGPIMASGEMNTVSEKELVARLNKAEDYRKRFKNVFGKGPSLDNIAKAIAAFERTIITKNAPFDKYVEGDKDALTAQQKRGLILFFGKASCVGCHNGPNFTDNKFHNLGLEQQGPLVTDDGRYAVTKKKTDIGKFKTPTLRNIAQTAPYMHDGSHRTLKEVVEYYNQGGGPGANRSDLIFPLHMNESEIEDVVAFLGSLTGELPMVTAPKIPAVER